MSLPQHELRGMPELRPTHRFAWSTLQKKALADNFSLKVETLAGSTSLEPSVAFFLRREVVELLEALYFKIETVTAPVWENAAALGIAFPKKKALRLLHKELALWLESQNEARKHFSWKLDSKSELHLNWKNKAKSLDPHEKTLRLRLRKGAREVEMLIPASALPDIAQVFRTLVGQETLNMPPPSPYAEKVAMALESLGALDKKNSTAIWRPNVDLRTQEFVVTSIGHAGLIVDSEESRILIDPRFFTHSSDYEVAPIEKAALGKIEAVFLTHHHFDHLDSGSLIYLNRDTKIFIPAGNKNTTLVRSREWLTQLGFTHVHEIKTGEFYTAASGLKVHAVPFYGEGSDRASFPASCFLFSRGARNVLAHADASPDHKGRSLVSEGMAKKLVTQHGAIELIFGTWWQQQGFAFRLGPLALLSPELKPKEWLNLTEACSCPPEYIRDLCRITGASHFATYAENGSHCYMHKNIAPPHLSSLSLFWKNTDDLQKALGKKTRVIEAAPFRAFCLPKKGALKIVDSGIAPSRKA